jgi:hypothetical protein
MLAKCERFHAWGAPFCRVIDPEKKAVWMYHKGQESRKVLPLDKNLDAGEITLSPANLFV